VVVAMRTSRVSQDTTRIFNALSSNARSRRTRSSGRRSASFALSRDGSVDVKEELYDSSDDTAVHSTSTPDIEDGVSTPRSSRTRKRKHGSASPTTSIITSKKERTEILPSSRKRIKGEEDDDVDGSPSRIKAKPKIPARKKTDSDGTVKIHPPSNWEAMYSIVKAFRKRNPTAPVDTMGCEDLFWPSAPPKEKRYHILTALMLSSQTKDTVTAAAMQRLHTELVEQKPAADGKIQASRLTVDNILACDPIHLNTLTGKVGFHNNKTKYIKAAAQMIKDEYNGEIPDTVEGLMRLPGVGPKMAYLCMSAAWGKDLGIGVDVHVHRITNLWGWHTTKNPEETRYWLEGWLPKDRWHEINKMLVGLGQTVCLPVGRRCGECALSGTGLCKAEIRGMKVEERKVKVVKEDSEEKVVVKDEVMVEVKEELVDS
jgi:endonuclease III